MGTKVYGTVGQKSDKYDFYVEYFTSFDASTMKHKVSAEVWLVVDSYKYSGTTSHSLSIGGTTVDKKSNYSKTCGNGSSKVEYLIASGSQTFAASSSSKEVTISAELTAPSGGYGPGTCKVSTKVTLSAKLVQSGEFSILSISQHSATLKVSGLKTGVGYDRTVKFYYKRSAASSWNLVKTVTVSSSSSSTSCEITSKLISNREYDFKAIIYTPTGTVLNTFTKSKTTEKDEFYLSKVSTTSSTINLSLTGLIEKVNLKRTLRIYYRRKGNTTWIELPARAKTINSGESFKTITYNMTGFSSNVTFEFEVDLYYEDEFYAGYAYCTATTKASSSGSSSTTGRTITATLKGDIVTVACTCNLTNKPIVANRMYFYMGRFGEDYEHEGYYTLGYYDNFSKNYTLNNPGSTYSAGDPVKLVWVDTNFNVVAIDQLDLKI